MAKLKLIVCLDDRYGILFQNRRISSDKEVIKHIQEITAGSMLICNAYSSKLFPDGSVYVSEDFARTSSDTAYYFVEGQDLTPVVDQVRELIVYRWNRIYPSDHRFPMDLFTERMQRVSCGHFRGSSHDFITWEVYRL